LSKEPEMPVDAKVKGANRPEFIRHFSEIEDDDSGTYPNSAERFTFSASFGRKLGLSQFNVLHEVLPPGRRTCWPHAHEREDEFVYVIEGAPDLWLDGALHRMRPGDGVALPAGTGHSHVLINNTSSDVRLMTVGAMSDGSDRVHYPLHPAQNGLRGPRHWMDHPKHALGDHDAMPDELRKAPVDPPQQA
jgi:uncharacterized cupin superfamily protein